MKNGYIMKHEERYYSNDFNGLIDIFKSIEQIEEDFGIEYSCGDNLFYDDIQDIELLKKYDGKLDMGCFRIKSSKKVFNTPRKFQIIFKEDKRFGDVVAFCKILGKH